jgi:hypothetical protein
MTRNEREAAEFDAVLRRQREQRQRTVRSPSPEVSKPVIHTVYCDRARVMNLNGEVVTC